jgi:hypothetical protein
MPELKSQLRPYPYMGDEKLNIDPVSSINIFMRIRLEISDALNREQISEQQDKCDLMRGRKR